MQVASGLIVVLSAMSSSAQQPPVSMACDNDKRTTVEEWQFCDIGKGNLDIEKLIYIQRYLRDKSVDRAFCDIYDEVILAERKCNADSNIVAILTVAGISLELANKFKVHESFVESNRMYSTAWFLLENKNNYLIRQETLYQWSDLKVKLGSFDEAKKLINMQYDEAKKIYDAEKCVDFNIGLYASALRHRSQIYISIGLFEESRLDMIKSFEIGSSENSCGNFAR